MFVSVIWNLWKMRNNFLFNNVDLHPNQVAIKSICLADNIHDAFKSNRLSGDSEPTLIKWYLPLAGKIKLNTDGSTSNVYGYASFGGVARGNNGKWIEGYCGFIGAASILKAELWAIKQAFKLCKEKGWAGAPVESDCLPAVELINDNTELPNHPERILIDECRALKAEMG